MTSFIIKFVHAIVYCLHADSGKALEINILLSHMVLCWFCWTGLACFGQFAQPYYACGQNETYFRLKTFNYNRNPFELVMITRSLFFFCPSNNFFSEFSPEKKVRPVFPFSNVIFHRIEGQAGFNPDSRSHTTCSRLRTIPIPAVNTVTEGMLFILLSYHPCRIPSVTYTFIYGLYIACCLACMRNDYALHN